MESTRITTPTGIDTLEKVNIGGIRQWILIRSWDIDNPVLLFMHGGPGALFFPFAREIGRSTQLEKSFTVIYWEQRGTGKSYSPTLPDSTMTINQLKADTYELVRYLIQKFSKRQVYLIARSFGTLTAIQVVEKHPELFHAYIAISQIINPLKNDSTSYEGALRIAKQLHNETAIEDLKEIGYPPYSYQKLLRQRKWLTYFHDTVLEKQAPDYRTLLLSTVEYSLIDIFLIGLNPYYSLEHLWNEQLYQINLFNKIRSIEVPIFFIIGRHDIFNDTDLVINFYDNLIAPQGKWLFWFNESGHEPEMDETEKFKDILLNYVISK